MSKDDTSGGHADALVLFGATGDLAHKMVFPALYAMVKRGSLSVPVIGVASSDWDLKHLCAHVRESIAAASGGVDDEQALDRLVALLAYVDGDYNDAATFTALASSSRSRSGATSPRRRSSIGLPARSSRRTRSSASITSSARRRS